MMETVDAIVLESAVAILTGGTDKQGCQLLTIPGESADILDLYSSANILRLLEVYVDLCQGQVAVLADFRHDWTEETIGKLTSLLDDLGATRRQCINTAYFIRPRKESTNRNQKGEYQNTRICGKQSPRYHVTWLENVDDVIHFIDADQLTAEFGGKLQYNHVALVDFYRTYMASVSDVTHMIESLSTVAEEIQIWKDSLIDGDVHCESSEIENKYAEKMKQFKVKDILEDCQDVIERLEHPGCDPSLVKINPLLLQDTVCRLKKYIKKTYKFVEEFDDIVAKTKAEHAVFIRLNECASNAKEVEETIELMKQHTQGLPLVGSSSEQAHYYRDQFNDSILSPSKDIVSCASSILQDLCCGRDIPPKAQAFAAAIAKRVTDAVQPFTEYLNKINEKYIRIHLFYVIYDKIKCWNCKASQFVWKSFNIRGSSPNNVKNPLVTNDHIEDRCSNIKIATPARVDAPIFWHMNMKKFYHKHPPPKKRHIKLISQSVPDYILATQKADAEVLAERTLFILQFLGKEYFKKEDIQLIQSWSQKSDKHLYVSLV